MILTHSGTSEISANLIADESDNIFTHRGNRGDINWGRATAETQLNPDISNATNKRRMRELFKEGGVPMPSLYTPDEAKAILSSGGHLVGRPDFHTMGRGLWHCYTVADFNRAMRGTDRKRPATHFMEWVDAPYEYRVHIFKGKSIRISEKSFDETGDYTTIKPTHEIKHVRKAAKKAMKAIGLDFGAVDILANDTEAWCLEVNAAPGLTGGSLPRVYADIFERWEAGELEWAA